MARDASTTLREDRPDGTTVEIVHEARGRVVLTRFADDSRVAARLEADLGPDGSVTVTRSEGAGEPVEIDPVTEEQIVNTYGALVRSRTYEAGLATELAYDDDTNLRSVTLRGPWGEHAMELRPDGARVSRWHTPLHDGVETRDASGHRVDYELTSTDGSRYHLRVTDDGTRVTTVDAAGRTTVSESAPGDEPDPPGP